MLFRSALLLLLAAGIYASRDTAVALGAPAHIVELIGHMAVAWAVLQTVASSIFRAVDEIYETLAEWAGGETGAADRQET